MITQSLRIAGWSFIILCGTTLAATPAHAGPPWISAEYPSNPYETGARGSFFLVHTYHHGAPMASRLSGTAEGIVNGRRQSVKLEFVSTSKPGVYAVNYRPAAAGIWVLAINMNAADHDAAAGMIVTVGRHGEISSVNVPTEEKEGGRWIIPRMISPQDITQALQAQTALLGGGAPQVGSNGMNSGMLLAAGLGLVLGLPLVRRLKKAA
jgi:hypothetical protein